jgi:hypothetical protein
MTGHYRPKDVDRCYSMEEVIIAYDIPILSIKTKKDIYLCRDASSSLYLHKQPRIIDSILCYSWLKKKEKEKT